MKVAIITNSPISGVKAYLNYNRLNKFYNKIDFNPTSGSYDLCLVYSKGSKEISKISIKENGLILLIGEPEGIYYYSKKFINQFDRVYSCRNDLSHKKIIKSPPFQTPWIGRENLKSKINYNTNYKSQYNLSMPKKSKLICVISSKKVYCKGHYLRRKFIEIINKNYSDIIDVYGYGYKQFNEKSKILNDYKYCIVIENTKSDYYWSEKIVDPMLSFCFPFYYGSNKINDYFLEKSYEEIDIKKGLVEIERILEFIKSHNYEEGINSLVKSRIKALDQHSFTNFLISLKSVDLGEQRKNKL